MPIYYGTVYYQRRHDKLAIPTLMSLLSPYIMAFAHTPAYLLGYHYGLSDGKVRISDSAACGEIPINNYSGIMINFSSLV